MTVQHFVVEFVILLLLQLWLITDAVSLRNPQIAKPNCSDRCGNVSIPFPFGIEAGCYMNESFKVTCNQTIHGDPKPFISSINLELLSFSLSIGTVRVLVPVTEFSCGKKDNGICFYINPAGSPFFFSHVYNRFASVGCGKWITIVHNQTNIGGCLLPKCSAETPINDCHTTIPPMLTFFVANLTNNPCDGGNHGKIGCGSAFMIANDILNPDGSVPLKFRNQTHVPTVLQWSIPIHGICKWNQGSNHFCDEGGNHCWTNLSSTHFCVCSRCYEDDTKYEDCQGCSTGIGSLVPLIGAWWSCELAKRRRNMKLKQKNFRNNGGLLLQERLSSDEIIRMSTSEELENATDHYSANRILGQGGEGIVYKGMLADRSIVAIKKPKVVGIGNKLDKKKLQQFINEMIILSQINHRNVVKLLGCCLETEVPLLVYEFINGTLYQHIHGEENEGSFPIRWEMRLRIASEVANALAYMHSSASAPIYHRNIKSSNILLDDKCRAKVSDFGTSRSILSEQTHLTTQVQGTFGYLDPEYFQSSHFTEKSDVYSFGVVLAVLLTGLKPLITSTQTARSLVSCFLLSMEENSLFDILDQCVMKDGSNDEIMAVTKLAKRCLNLNGKERLTMKEVSMELELIRVLKEAHAIQKHQDEDSNDTIEPWGAASSSTNNFN